MTAKRLAALTFLLLLLSPTLAANVSAQSAEADLVVTVGDMDNLGFGWPDGFDVFSGNSTPIHGYPWTPEADDPAGTDRIMVGTSYDGSDYTIDGYTRDTSRPANLPEAITLTYSLSGLTVRSALLQMFVDDFQSPYWGSSFQVELNGRRAPFVENAINALNQTGPIGKLISLQVPADFLAAVSSGHLTIYIDDPTTGQGDGYAIDFVRLLINPSLEDYSYLGTITGTVTDAESGLPLQGITMSAGGAVETVTAFDGTYTLADVPAGLATVTASGSGYESQTLSVDLVADGRTTLDFSLEAGEPEPTPTPTPTPTSTPPPDGNGNCIKFGNREWTDLSSVFRGATQVLGATNNKASGVGFMDLWLSFDSPSPGITLDCASDQVHFTLWGPTEQNECEYALLDIESPPSDQLSTWFSTDDVPSHLVSILEGPYLYRAVISCSDSGYACTYTINFDSSPNAVIGRGEVDTNASPDIRRVVVCATGGTTPPPDECSWNGTWDTNWGTMELVQRASEVSGTYTHDEGRIAGTVSGNTLAGTWSEAPSYDAPNDAGDIELTMSADCRSFTGRWRYGSSGAWGDWTGSRIDSGTVTPPSTPRTVLITEPRTVSEGDTVSVPVRLENGRDIGSMNFSVAYDPTVVTVNGVDKGYLLSNIMFAPNYGEPGLVRFGFASDTGLSGSGPVAYIEFEAVGSQGDSTPVTLSVESTTDASGQDVSVSTRNGSITIEGEGLLGDYNRDGRITELDALAALKMSVGLLEEDLILDMDQSGKVTAEDARLILLHAVGAD